MMFKAVRQRRPAHQSIPTLYEICIRLVSRNLDIYHELHDLSELPQTIKTDLMRTHMKSFRGFGNEDTFICLLTTNVKSLLFRSTNVTDRMLECIANRCRQLEQFLLPIDPSDFTMIGLCQCLMNLENLRVLHVTRNSNVTDRVLDVVARKCTKLHSLSVRECSNVTNMAAKSLQTLSLIELDLTKTMITDDFLVNTRGSHLMECLRDISLRDCAITKRGLLCLDWERLENVNIIGTHIEDLSFIPTTAVYKTLNFSI